VYQQANRVNAHPWLAGNLLSFKGVRRLLWG
jgi:hypothetical protein